MYICLYSVNVTNVYNFSFEVYNNIRKFIKRKTVNLTAFFLHSIGSDIQNVININHWINSH